MYHEQSVANRYASAVRQEEAALRAAGCHKTFCTLQPEPNSQSFLSVEPYQRIPVDDASQLNCRRRATRHPRETKGLDYEITTEASGDCGAGGSCC